jgi:hypothetical protein
MTAEAASVKRRAAGMASTIAERLPDDARLLQKTCDQVSLQSHLVVEMGGTRYAVSVSVVGRADELPRPEDTPR